MAGGMRWELVGCLALAWAIVAVVLIRGISSLGKVGVSHRFKARLCDVLVDYVNSLKRFILKS